jgi:hypothetical protein
MNNVVCHCNLPVKTCVSKSANNPNRAFYACPHPKDQQCKFFAWVDEAPRGGARTSAAPAAQAPINQGGLLIQETLARLEEKLDLILTHQSGAPQTGF